MEVLERLRCDPTSAAIPVILVTAKAADWDLLAGYKSGADYYVIKPFTARQILYAIGHVLGGQQPR